MEYMLGVALQGDHLILLLEVIKANGTGDFSLVLDGVKVFACQSLRDLSELIMEDLLATLELPPLVNGMGQDVSVGKRIPNLDVANVDVGQDQVGEQASVFLPYAVIFAREVDQVTINQPSK